MSAQIDPEMDDLLQGDPSQELDAIILAQGRLDDLLASLPDEVTVNYKYRLIGSVSVTAPAGTLRRLATMKSVKAIEPVRDVSHC